MLTEIEKHKERRFPSNSLTLKNIEGIRVEDTVITPQTLESDRARWTGFALLPGIGERKLGASDEELVRQLLFENVPFEIVGSPDDQTVLRAELVRFPYSIFGGKRVFQSFGLRLVPEKGRIERIELRGNCSIALNEQTITPSLLSMDLGNENIHLEVYFEPQDPATMQPLQPPKGFRESITLDHSSLID